MSVPPTTTSDDTCRDDVDVYTHPRHHESIFCQMTSDLESDSIWCYHRRRGIKQDCERHELCRVSLLGRMVKYHDMLVCLCPKCAFPMHYDPARCAVTPLGVVCSFCTREIDQARYTTRAQLQIELGVSAGKCTCVGCDTVLSKSSSIYVYPFKLFLCSKCSSRNVSSAVDLAMITSTTDTNRDSIYNIIVHEITKRKQDREMWKQKRYACYGHKTKKQWLNQAVSASIGES